jgi:hypothetical protein
MRKFDKIIEIIKDFTPKQLQTNTDILITLYNKEFIKRGLPPLSYSQQQVLRDFKPETVTRARRKWKEGTQFQYEEEVQTRDFFSQESNPPLFE